MTELFPTISVAWQDGDDYICLDCIDGLSTDGMRPVNSRQVQGDDLCAECRAYLFSSRPVTDILYSW